MNMDIHKLLKRQLDKTQLQLTTMPSNQLQWEEFLSRINQTYIEADQERYLNERSMEIFSREMMALNVMLEKAQRIACLGYWSFDANADNLEFSKEIFKLFQINPAEIPKTYDAFMKLVHEQDIDALAQKVKNALEQKQDYEQDIRLRNANGEYRWFQTIAQCKEEDNKLTGIIIDIHRKKEAEEKISELNQKVVSTARKAGMVEVATSILHNIGNILNSSNVSISLLKKASTQSYQQRFLKVVDMLLQNRSNLVEFLTNDPKGKVIPDYIMSVSPVILEEQKNNSAEIDSLAEDLNHIKQIVSMQQSISGVSTIKEKVYIPDLIDVALNISINSANDKLIEIVKQFEQCPMIDIDKSKLLQILINLIQNARDAILLNQSNPIKEIIVNVKKIPKERIQVSVEDNGIGIDAENLTRIFAFGFTTKENGHGFGLHSAALSANEMGGSLKAESKGVGQGSQFILTLPLSKNSETKGVFNE